MIIESLSVIRRSDQVKFCLWVNLIFFGKIQDTY